MYRINEVRETSEDSGLKKDLVLVRRY